MSQHLDRATQLMAIDRYADAEKELRLALADDPEDGATHSLLAISLANQDKLEEATSEARRGIHLEPGEGFGHYTLANVLAQRKRADEAEAPAREAVRLDPENPRYRASLGWVLFAQRRWTESLDAADEGLRLDAEHVDCTNLRAMSLVRLGRKDEAAASLETNLASDPQNSYSHANQGWLHLEQRRPDKALEHFTEALRLEPGNEFARAGLVEALKARYSIYRWMLSYFLWMSKLRQTSQWMIIIGLALGNRIIRGLGREHPELAPFLWPIGIAYVLFVFMSWFADPLFNLILRMNRAGRLALSTDQRRGSTLFGAGLFMALAGAGLGIAGVPFGWYLLIFFGLLLFPATGIHHCDVGWPRRMMSAYTALVAAAGIAFLVFPPAGWIFLFGCLFAFLPVNLLAAATAKR